MIDRFRAAMVEVGVAGVIEHYPGPHHDFAFPDRGGFYDEPATQRLWSRRLELFACTLRAAPE